MSDRRRIPYPKPTEFEVQAEAYVYLKSAGYDVRGEISVHGNRSQGTRGARFDLVIYDWQTKQALLIIEAKRNPNGQGSKQGGYYSRFTGLKCIYIRGMKDIGPQLLAEVEANLAPVTWKQVVA